MTNVQLLRLINNHIKDGMVFQCAIDSSDFMFFDSSKLVLNEHGAYMVRYDGTRLYLYDDDKGIIAKTFVETIKRKILVEKFSRSSDFI